MKNDDRSIYEMEIKPFTQVAIIISTALVLMLSWLAARELGIDLKQRTPWLISSGLMLFFGLFNSVFSLSATDRMRYWRDSIFGYIVLGFGGGFLAWLFSGLTIDEAGAFKWMYFIFTFSFITFLTIINIMRKIVDLAQKQDKRLRGEE